MSTVSGKLVRNLVLSLLFMAASDPAFAKKDTKKKDCCRACFGAGQEGCSFCPGRV